MGGAVCRVADRASSIGESCHGRKKKACNVVGALVETAVFPVDQWQSRADGNISQRTPVLSKHTNTPLAPCPQNTRLSSGTVSTGQSTQVERSLCPFTKLAAEPCFNGSRSLANALG